MSKTFGKLVIIVGTILIVLPWVPFKTTASSVEYPEKDVEVQLGCQIQEFNGDGKTYLKITSPSLSTQEIIIMTNSQWDELIPSIPVRMATHSAGKSRILLQPGEKLFIRPHGYIQILQAGCR